MGKYTKRTSEGAENLHEDQKNTDQLRTQRLEDLAAYRSDRVGTQIAVELKKLIHIEEVRKTARKHG